MNNPALKTCYRCKEALPSFCFSVYNRTGKTQPSTYCKACQRAINRARADRLWQERNATRIVDPAWYQPLTPKQERQRRALMVNSCNHRARQLGLPGRITVDEWLRLCAFFRNCCLGCGRTRQLSPDHVVPLSGGGANTIGNIQPLCNTCNVRKGTYPYDYRPRNI